ncbi:hypothetical protein F443_22268 [Phytophthora nicotianae P1569]|uniref:Uncharacterized protein n=1 Tax=Phytophthora nicotianae P1569 TaxID=1317065 RepID=V9DUP4_PHYNI|nr:hypothetical protein F443_22268 [Phytophthora nicotianae P1569]
MVNVFVLRSLSRKQVPATLRLQRAMEAHTALQARTVQQGTDESEETPSDDTSASVEIPISAASTDDLATQLRNLWQREKNQHQEQDNDSQRDDDIVLPDLKTMLQKIGSREKDELLLLLLEQQETLRSQCNEVAELGEKIAAQLIHQQHEVRQKYREQRSKLEEQLHEALYFNPQVTVLQAKVEELEESNREHEQKLRFAGGTVRRMAQRGNAWTEDDEHEVKQSLHQKEAITAQMIGIISARLNSLQTTANNRKHGLECDLRVNSDYCSKMVPPLVDMLESRGAAAAKSRAISSTTLASNQAMLERLFGPDERTKTHTQLHKKKKLEVHKGDNKRNARGQIEKQLQASVEGHITRTVESFVYGVNDGDIGGASSRGNVYMNTTLLLVHTFERIHISHGRRNFKRFLLSELSGALFEEVFWLVFCHFYQKESLAQQRALADEISAKYIKMVAALRGSMDYLFRVYPYAIASGICSGFYYLFPGSRHLYSPEFKNDVYLFVCQLLLGLKMTPASVQSMRRQYFPEEVVDDIGIRIKPVGKLTASASTGAISDAGNGSARNGDISHLPRLLSPQTAQTLAKSASETSYLGKLATGDNSIAKILEPPVTSIYSANLDDQDDFDALPRLRRHQQRALFNASQLSPLMKQYFRSPTMNAQKASFVLRTTPSADCAVGGEETFHKFYRRKAQKGYAAEAQRQHEKCIREIQKEQRDTKREIAALHETRDLVLSSGKKSLQAYCTVLMSRKHVGEEENATPTAAGSSNIAIGTGNQP